VKNNTFWDFGIGIFSHSFARWRYRHVLHRYYTLSVLIRCGLRQNTLPLVGMWIHLPNINVRVMGARSRLRYVAKSKILRRGGLL